MATPCPTRAGKFATLAPTARPPVPVETPELALRKSNTNCRFRQLMISHVDSEFGTYVLILEKADTSDLVDGGLQGSNSRGDIGVDASSSDGRESEENGERRHCRNSQIKSNICKGGKVSEETNSLSEEEKVGIWPVPALTSSILYGA